MPIYDFRCEKCQMEHEYVLGMNEPRPQTCDFCGGKLHRIFQAAPVLFGPGFPGNDLKKRDKYTRESLENEKKHGLR